MLSRLATEGVHLSPCHCPCCILHPTQIHEHMQYVDDNNDFHFPIIFFNDFWLLK